jgi:hypothetical protein
MPAESAAQSTFKNTKLSLTGKLPYSLLRRGVCLPHVFGLPCMSPLHCWKPFAAASPYEGPTLCYTFHRFDSDDSEINDERRELERKVEECEASKHFGPEPEATPQQLAGAIVLHLEGQTKRHSACWRCSSAGQSVCGKCFDAALDLPCCAAVAQRCLAATVPVRFAAGRTSSGTEKYTSCHAMTKLLCQLNEVSLAQRLWRLTKHSLSKRLPAN